MTVPVVSAAACALCGAKEPRLLLRARDRFEESADEYSIVQCDACGLVALSPKPGPESWARLYPSHYYSYQPAAAPKQLRSDRIGRLREWRKLRGFRLPVGAKVLEIGCGSGASLDWHLQQGRECHGVEINSQAVALGTARGITMHLGDVEQAAFTGEMFHLVLAQQVFEHVDDPLRWLHEVHRILRPDGRLLISVPNHASLNRRLFGRHWIGYDVPRHCHAFSPRTLRAGVQSSGFRCLAIDHVANYFTLAASMMLAMSRHRPPAAVRAAEQKLNAPCVKLMCLPLALAADVLRVSDVVRVLAERR